MRSSSFPSFARASVLPLAMAWGLAASACGQEGNTIHHGGEGGSGAGTSTGTGAGGDGQGGSLPPKPLKILDWNVHNFFNDKSADNSPDAPFPDTTAEYAAHRAAIAAILKDAHADVVVLAEVENQATLDDLNDDDLAGLYGDAVLVEGNDTRGIDVGALSKIPFADVVSHKDDVFTEVGTTGPNFRFARDCLELHLEFNGRKIVLLGVHFRAKTAPDEPKKRLAEAQRARAIANQILADDPSTLVVVLGDYNDTPGSPPVAAVLGSGETAFTDAAESAASGDRWSYDFSGKLELIDHQAVSPGMAALLDAGSVTIVHGSDVDAASDHAPIAATYLVH